MKNDKNKGLYSEQDGLYKPYNEDGSPKHKFEGTGIPGLDPEVPNPKDPELNNSFENIEQTTFTATWRSLSVGIASRVMGAYIQFNQLPSNFSYSVFRVQVRSGSGSPSDPYTWTNSTGWDISNPGFRSPTSTDQYIQAVASYTVPAGTYRLVLPANAFGKWRNLVLLLLHKVGLLRQLRLVHQ